MATTQEAFARGTKGPAKPTQKALSKAPAKSKPKIKSAKAPAKREAKAAEARRKNAAPKAAVSIQKAVDAQPGALPILYMLSPAKFMSPFDCNMAADAGYKVVLPYDNVTVGDVGALVQDLIFSRPPKARTGVFLGGKDIETTMAMMAAAKAAMVPPFEVSVFADPGGSFTTAAAMVAHAEQVLLRQFKRGLRGLKLSVFGAQGVVGFAASVIAALEGAHVQTVAHADIAPLEALAKLAKEKFGATLHPVAGHTETLKSGIINGSDAVFTAGPAGVNIISKAQIARASRLMVAADVNAVPAYGIEGIELFMNGVPLPGSSALGIGALAIGDIKYKTQAGLFRRMIETDEPLHLDFRDAFKLARELAGGLPKPKRVKAAA